MSSSLEAAEKLKLLLIQMRDTCRQSQAIEHEAIIEREQRSMAKDARLDDLFRDLKYVQDGIEDIKENQLTTGVETGKLHKGLYLGTTVSSEAVEEILRVAEDNRKTQLAHLVALMEGKGPLFSMHNKVDHNVSRVFRKTQGTKYSIPEG
ncbi:hypothetical protein H0H92_006036 [Tricholoma furcatifolium]|nr:hypothetical protein H0H92_006036 [Tricholoma furcatifolium]